MRLCQEGVLQTQGPGLEGGPQGTVCTFQELGTQESFLRSCQTHSVLSGHLFPQLLTPPAGSAVWHHGVAAPFLQGLQG